MNKMFEFLEKYLMGPMGKVSTWRPVRANCRCWYGQYPLYNSRINVLGS